MDTIWEAFPSFRCEIKDDPPESAFLCRHCGAPKVFNGTDEYGSIDLPTCTSCGIVDAEYVSEEPEWRTGADNDGPDPTRVGAPSNLDHFSEAWGTGTRVQGIRYGGRNFYEAKKLARRHMHCNSNYKDRNLFHAYEGMDKIGTGVLGLKENVMYLAKIKYKKFNENVLTRGAVRTGVKANCIFQACRELGVARTIHEIAEAFGIPSRDMSRTVEMYNEQLPETDVHITSAANVVARIFNQVTHVPDAERGRVRRKIINTCEQIEECIELMGKTPKAIACAVMFHVLANMGHPVSRKDICKICDISGPTLTKIDAIVKAKIQN